MSWSASWFCSPFCRDSRMASGFPMGQGQPYQELKWFGIFIQVAVGPAVPGGDVLLKMNLRGAFTI